jgi:mRNA-degrading endonuclease toxin of MazEF toxin-antitoxin module
MRRGAVYLCTFGQPEVLVPSVVLTREAINRSGPVLLVAPIVGPTGGEGVDPSVVLLRAPDGGLTTDGRILTTHLRPVPRASLQAQLGPLSGEAMDALDQALRHTLDLAER